LKSPRELIELQLSALVECDARGRASVFGDGRGTPAPWVLLGRTAEGNAWRLSALLPDALAREAEALLATEPATGDFESEPRCAEDLRHLFAGQVTIAREWRGPAFALPEGLPDPGEVEVDAATLRAVVRVGEVELSSCECARLTPEVAEAGLETHPDHRRRGLATRVVSAWARAIRASGRLPLYSTAWSNAGSRGVARKLGAHLYGEDFHLDP
jgi:GNAT superfamily N-acetyltransferase